MFIFWLYISVSPNFLTQIALGNCYWGARRSSRLKASRSTRRGQLQVYGERQAGVQGGRQAGVPVRRQARRVLGGRQARVQADGG